MTKDLNRKLNWFRHKYSLAQKEVKQQKLKNKEHLSDLWVEEQLVKLSTLKEKKIRYKKLKQLSEIDMEN